MSFSRLIALNNIVNLERQYAIEYGIRPLNVSNWTVSNEFRNYMISNMRTPTTGNNVDYIYTHSMSRIINEDVRYKLGVKSINDTAAVFTHNNTISIINVINYLKLNKYNNICIIDPSYFSIEDALNSFQIKHDHLSIIWESNRFKLPIDKILLNNYDAVWITSPIYSTGVYLSPNDIDNLSDLMNENILVITDESFALNGYELARHLDIGDKFIGIYSPHKSISMNGFKFSTIVCSDTHKNFFEQWSDVFCGNLHPSCYNAIFHFLSNDYECCLRAFDEFISRSKVEIHDALNDAKTISIDPHSLGSLITLYCNSIPEHDWTSLDFMKRLIYTTHSSLYPSYLNRFNMDMFGPCFRINLALNSANFHSSLCRIIRYLDSFY